MNSISRSARAATHLGGMRLLAAMGCWLLACGVVGIATVGVGRLLAGDSPIDANTVTPIIVAEVYVLLIACLAVVLRPTFRERVALHPVGASAVVLTIAAVAVAYAVTAAVQSIVSPLSWANTLTVLRGVFSDDGRLATASPAMLATILLRACVLAAVGEELLFRGALHTWLRQRVSAKTTIAITSTLFAVIHGFPPILPLTFAIGVAFGWMRERSGSIAPTIIVHALHNTVMIAASFVLTGWSARLPQWGG